MPADEETLIQYVAFLARSIKHSSIKNYLAAVRHLHIRNGYELNLKKCLRLQLICRGIKRSQGCSTCTRLPITINHLKLFSCLLAVPQVSRFDSLMIWAAMTLPSLGFSASVNLHATLCIHKIYICPHLIFPSFPLGITLTTFLSVLKSRRLTHSTLVRPY